MPTPNQTTPDSPERVRGETPRTDAAAKYDPHCNLAVFARKIERELNAATNDAANCRQIIDTYVSETDQLRAETTRLAEALKEGINELMGVAALLREREINATAARLERMAQKFTALTQPAPISGAKK